MTRLRRLHGEFVRLGKAGEGFEQHVRFWWSGLEAFGGALGNDVCMQHGRGHAGLRGAGLSEAKVFPLPMPRDFFKRKKGEGSRAATSRLLQASMAGVLNHLYAGGGGLGLWPPTAAQRRVLDRLHAFAVLFLEGARVSPENEIQ